MRTGRSRPLNGFGGIWVIGFVQDVTARVTGVGRFVRCVIEGKQP